MIRHANPEIARGEYRAVKSEGKVGGFVSVYDGSAVCVLHNATLDEQSFDLSAIADRDFSVIAAAIGQGGASLDGSVLILAPQTSAVLREA